MGNDSGVQAVLGLTGLNHDSAMLRVTGERSLRVDLPASFTREHAAYMENDFAVLSELASKHPHDIVEIHNAVLRNDFDSATAGARKIGLTEEALVERGGGQIGIVIGIVVILAVAALVMSDSGGGSQPEPVGPGDGEGPKDAGADG